MSCAGKNIIYWPAPPAGIIDTEFLNMDEIKTVLDLNASNSLPFAIYKSGDALDKYKCILLADGLIKAPGTF